MHELAICQALIDELMAHAEPRMPARLTSVTVEVGPLCGVVPDLLHQAYEFAKIGTVAAAAELIIDAAEVRIYCDSCEVETVVLPNRLICGECGTWHTRLLTGDELLLRAIEFADASCIHERAR